jgi:hypothetical protein
MNVIGVHVVDLHIETLAFGVLSQITRHPARQLLLAAAFRDLTFPKSDEASNGNKSAVT